MPATPDGRAAGLWHRRITECAVSAAGGALMLAAALANAGWFDRHVFVPHYLTRPPALSSWLRLAMAAAGLILVVALRPRAGRAVNRCWVLRAASPGSAKPRPRPVATAAWVVAALLAAVVAAEGGLRLMRSPTGGPGYGAWRLGMVAPHPRFGWAARPSRTTTLEVAGHRTTYAVNALGFRARAADDAPDLTRPTLVVTGESFAAGMGLAYEQTFATLSGQALGLQVVNVAEGGYGVDQAYQRLIDVLPRLAEPVVVVTVFVAAQLGRSLKDGRPHLALDDHGALVLEAAATGIVRGSRLWRALHDDLPLLGEDALQKALALNRRIVIETAAAARRREARPLFLILSLGPPRPLDRHDEAWVIRSLFVEPGVPYLLVDLDADHVIPHDGHPNAAGARRIAEALEALLRNGAGPSREAPSVRRPPEGG